MNRICFPFVFLFVLGVSQIGFSQLSKHLTMVNPDVPAACPDCVHMPDMYRQNCNVRKLKESVIKELNYPQDARDRGVEGEVKVGLTINVEGKIVGTRIIKKLDKVLDAEALRIAEVLQKDDRPWLPGKMNNNVVQSEYELTIPFVLNPVSAKPGISSENRVR